MAIRHSQPIETTLQLVDVIKSALPQKVLYEKKHPCRVFFQAIRIKVNNELQVIHDVLQQLDFVMKKNGVVIFLTFHSLEEQIIKH